MKSLLFLFVLATVSAQASSVRLKDYNYSVEDIRDLKTTKETLFERMDRRLMKVDDSICSNRAAMWTWDFHLDHVPSAKIFMFYTAKSGRFDGFSWWYHTSPVVNEKGTLYVMDAGNPKYVSTPLTVKDWMNAFVKTSNCKEITHQETELLKLIFRGKAFPETTGAGTFDCYYKITPPGYWTPSQVAMNALGMTANGTPIRFERDEPSEKDTFKACLEATTSMWGYLGRLGGQKCREFLTKGSEFHL